MRVSFKSKFNQSQMIIKHMIKLTMHVIQKISFENKNIPVMHNSRAKDVKNSN